MPVIVHGLLRAVSGVTTSTIPPSPTLELVKRQALASVAASGTAETPFFNKGNLDEAGALVIALFIPVMAALVVLVQPVSNPVRRA